MSFYCLARLDKEHLVAGYRCRGRTVAIVQQQIRRRRGVRDAAILHRSTVLEVPGSGSVRGVAILAGVVAVSGLPKQRTVLERFILDVVVRVRQDRVPGRR